MSKVIFKVLSSSLLFIFLCLSINLAHAEPIDGNAYENWTLRCEESEGRQSCFIFQNLVLQNGGSSILHVAVGYLPGDRKLPVILISMPLGISLPPGASIQVDEQEPITFQIERCESTGCRGGFKLNSAMMETFKKGKTATVTFHDGRRQAIDMPLSLNGFSAGIDALDL